MSGPAETSARIVANGEEQEIRLPCTVTEFLLGLGWKPTQVVVERNRKVLAKADYDTTALVDGDLHGDQLAETRTHLEHCERCRTVLDGEGTAQLPLGKL